MIASIPQRRVHKAAQKALKTSKTADKKYDNIRKISGKALIPAGMVYAQVRAEDDDKYEMGTPEVNEYEQKGNAKKNYDECMDNLKIEWDYRT